MRRIATILSLILVLVFIDFLSKQYVQDILANRMHEYFPIVGEYLGISLSYNSGIAFSFPITGIPLRIITAILVFALGIYYLWYEYPKNLYLLDIGFSCIMAGALSHAYERIFNGYVVDFIWVKYFAILNFADIFISIGACLIFFVYYVMKK